MWYNQFTFFDKAPGLAIVLPADYFTRPYTSEEFVTLKHIDTMYPAGETPATYPVPSQLQLPPDYIELLQYSNGGGIINGKREFGYFSPETIRAYYISYGFQVWAPAFLPIALNGGGSFYAYDCRQPGLPIVAVAAGNIGYDPDCWAFLGNTLHEVLSQPTNIEEDLDRLIKKPEPNDTDIRKMAIRKALTQLKVEKDKGNMELKIYLLKKRELEEEMKALGL
jgi:hypothetical protein